MTILEKLKILIPDATPDVLTILLEDAEQEFKAYCNRETIPENANTVLIQMVQCSYNRLGAEGINSVSFSNVNESYTDGYPDNILQQLNAFRKVKFL